MATNQHARRKKSSPAASPKAATATAPRPSASPDANLTASQVQKLYQKLVDERDGFLERLRRHVNEATEEADPLPYDADLASRHANQAYLLRFADKEYQLLREIPHALNKMHSGEYGVCEGNGEPIGIKRLQLRPWTRYSVHYKEELERERSQRRR